MAAHDLVGTPVEGLGVAVHFGIRVQIGAEGAQQIPVRDHPHQLLFLHHQQVAKVRLFEDLLDDAQPVVHGDGRNPGRHDLFNQHGQPPAPQMSLL